MTLSPKNEYGAYLDERVAANRAQPSLAGWEALALDAISFALDHPYETAATDDRCIHCGDIGSYAHEPEQQREWREHIRQSAIETPEAE